MVPIDHFDTAAALTPDAPAIIDGDLTLTFAHVTRISHQLAKAVAVAGPAPAPVVIYSPNDYRVLLAMIGIMRAGGVIVPVHAGNPLDSTVRFLQQVRPRIAFFHSSLTANMRGIRQRVPTIGQVICLDAVVEGSQDFAAIASGAGCYDADWIDAAANRDRPVFYWSTSGTTGEPKVVIDDVVSFDGAMMLVRSEQVAKGDRYISLAIAPLSHGAGPHSFAILSLGGTVIVMRLFDPREVLSMIERYRVTDMWLSPSALYLLLESPDARKSDLSSLRHLRLGTAGVAPAKIKEAIEIFGPCVSQTYGQIESGFVTALDTKTGAAAAAGECPERLMSAGRSLFVNRVGIMAGDGRLLPPGENGEIVVRGGCVKRYLDDAATRDARRFGWHHTGDIGYLDDGGFLYVVGRLKDVINMAGIKIPAAELESVIMEMPDVLECAVVGVPDRIRGEVPYAVISTKTRSVVTADAVIAHCRQRVGGARAPAHVDHWSELPKSAAGKIDKQRIRALIGENAENVKLREA